MAHLPVEARDGLMRAWISVLSERHPNVAWVQAPPPTEEPEPNLITINFNPHTRRSGKAHAA